MLLHIFAVRDIASDQFGNPMFLIAPGQAIRSFSDEVNREDAQNMMYNHPDDFELFELGSFDTTTGLFDVHMPKSLASGKLVKVRSVPTTPKAS